ncbi:hypothetical protein POM88_016272 [Heracleum sosnowskyi]|uniref:Cytochrome P450 n=1 Tax=Heracleum sosnowskyi TaxID=360622 RepID=A0AAD8IN67_9APIA|nr:hypothetical protein POM88_016272 [Heracleum sosnowskyi]
MIGLKLKDRCKTTQVHALNNPSESNTTVKSNPLVTIHSILSNTCEDQQVKFPTLGDSTEILFDGFPTSDVFSHPLSFFSRILGDSKLLRRCLQSARQHAVDPVSKVVVSAWLRYERREDELVGVSGFHCVGRVLKCLKAALVNGAQLNFCHVREQEVSRMIAQLSETAAASKDVNAYEWFSNLATCIISRVAFGKRYDEDGIGKERFQRMLSEIDAMFIGFFVSDFFLMLGWIDKLSGMRARLDRTFKDLDMFYQELIDEHLKPNRLESPTEDLIDVMLKNEGSSLTKDSMKAILLNVFNGGTGTTATVFAELMLSLLCSIREKGLSVCK